MYSYFKSLSAQILYDLLVKKLRNLCDFTENIWNFTII